MGGKTPVSTLIRNNTFYQCHTRFTWTWFWRRCNERLCLLLILSLWHPTYFSAGLLRKYTVPLLCLCCEKEIIKGIQTFHPVLLSSVYYISIFLGLGFVALFPRRATTNNPNNTHHFPRILHFLMPFTLSVSETLISHNSCNRFVRRNDKTEWERERDKCVPDKSIEIYGAHVKRNKTNRQMIIIMGMLLLLCFIRARNHYNTNNSTSGCAYFGVIHGNGAHLCMSRTETPRTTKPRPLYFN